MAPTRYQVSGYAADDGLHVKAVQYVDNVVSTGGKWATQTHLEANIWQHNIGYGMNGTYCVFWLDGSTWFNSSTNIRNVTNNVTISDRGENYSEGYRYAISYDIFIEFDNNLENPADGPYAYAQFKHHMPGETTEGFEYIRREHRDNNRYLYQDCGNSREFRSSGIVSLDHYNSKVADRISQWQEKGNDGKTTVFIGASHFDTEFWSNFYTESYPGKDALCLGVGGTKTYDWAAWANGWLAETNPKQIITSVGGNNLGDGYSAEDTVFALQNLFALIHEKFPNVPIYMCNSLELGKASEDTTRAQMAEINKQMKAWCETQDYITYVDISSKITSDMMRADGIHISTEYYYLIRDALAEAGVVIEDL